MAKSNHPFALGWDFKRSEAARDAMLRSGKFAVVARAEPAPRAFSITDCRTRHLEQGQAGTCWLHSAVQLAEISMTSLGYDAFDVCRRLVGFVGKHLEGGGNPTDGGDPTDAIRAMTSDANGGMAHESLWPYSDDPYQLAMIPPPPVWADASVSHLALPVDVRSDDDSRQLISNGHPVCNGMWWPYGFDAPQTFMDELGPGSYGHSLTEVGYVQAGVWDRYDWWQLDNWHGLLYPPLPPDKAALVPGYKPITPEATSDFWVRGDQYRRLQNRGHFVRVSATDLSVPDLVVTKYQAPAKGCP